MEAHDLDIGHFLKHLPKSRLDHLTDTVSSAANREGLCLRIKLCQAHMGCYALHSRDLSMTWTTAKKALLFLVDVWSML